MKTLPPGHPVGKARRRTTPPALSTGGKGRLQGCSLSFLALIRGHAGSLVSVCLELPLLPCGCWCGNGTRGDGMELRQGRVRLGVRGRVCTQKCSGTGIGCPGKPQPQPCQRSRSAGTRPCFLHWHLLNTAAPQKRLTTAPAPFLPAMSSTLQQTRTHQLLLLFRSHQNCTFASSKTRFSTY